MAALREADLAPAGETATSSIAAIALCLECGLNARAGRGVLSRCTGCIRAAAQRDRDARIEAEALLAKRQEAPQKQCRSCKRLKAVTEYSPHRLARDGRRHDCRACVSAGRAKRKPLTAAQLEAKRLRQQQPDRRAKNLEAVVAWQQRNPAAMQAARTLDKDVRSGQIAQAKTCEAVRCRARSRLHGHHNSYRRRRVAWLCSKHHRACHAGVPIRLKKTAAFRVARAPETN